MINHIRTKNDLFIKRNQKGITLISLVITIILLFILAGITISLTLGQDGIITKAQQAGKNYMNSAEYEKDQLAKLTNTTNNLLDSFESFENTKQGKYYKQLLADAITQKGIPTSSTASMNEILSNLQKLKTYIMQEGETGYVTLKSREETNITIPFTNYHNQIPFVYLQRGNATGGFTFYHSVPNVSENTITFTLKNGASSEGSITTRWKAIFLTDTEKNETWNIHDERSLKQALAYIITKKGVTTDEAMSIETMVDNILALKIYTIETRTLPISFSSGTKQYNITCQNQNQKPPIFIFKDNAMTRNLFISMQYPVSNQESYFHFWNTSSSSISTTLEWTAFTL